MKFTTRLVAAVAVVLAAAGPAFAAEPVERTGSLTVVKNIPLGQLMLMPKVYEAQKSVLRGAKKPARQLGPLAVDPLAIYSDVTTFSGSAFAQGPSADQTGNQITRLVADDLTITTNPGVSNVTTVRFSVANLNATAVSARARIRFWSSDGASLGSGLPNGPGTLVTGYSFNAVSFGSGVTLLSGNLGTGFAVPAGTTSTIWAGLTFDNNIGGTGATAAQMDNFGQGLYAPVDLGSSTDLLFETTAAGSFFASSPAGSGITFGGAPVANTGWELVVTTLPVELQKFAIE